MDLRVIALVLVTALTVPACQTSGAYTERMAPSASTGFAVEARRELLRDASAAPSEEAAKKRSAVDRKVIRSANLSLTVQDVDETGRQIESLAATAGGFVLSSSRNSYHIKVPATGLDAALEQLATYGEITSRSLSGEDVTAEYVDLEVRLKNAHAARESYEALLRKAATVEEMLQVEKALHEVQERIERLEGRRKFLDEHLALSDIRIHLREERARGPLQVLWDVVSWPFKKLWWL